MAGDSCVFNFLRRGPVLCVFSESKTTVFKLLRLSVDEALVMRAMQLTDYRQTTIHRLFKQ